MSGFDWERNGPPRPGSSSMDHPRGIERPYVAPKTDAQKRQRREELAREKEARGIARMADEWEERYGKDAPNVWRRMMLGL